MRDRRNKYGDEGNLTGYMKRTWAEVDLDAALHNFTVIKEQAGGSKVMAVVKADACGHGARMLSRLYDENGADAFAVSNLEEGVQLRRWGIGKPILVLGYTPPEEAGALAAADIAQALFSSEYAARLSRFASEAGVTVKVHIKVDTGMGRLGFDCRREEHIAAAAEEAAAAVRLPGLLAEGIFTHFASADLDGDPDGSFTASQYARFRAAADAVEAAGICLPYKHCCNSAGLMLHPEMGMDYVRPGIILHGLTPSPGLPFMDRFKPTLSLKSTVSFVKPLAAGDTVSYGRTYKAERPILAATVAIGYADGYPRLLSGRGRALIRGKSAPIIGRVCMDQMVVDVTGIPGVKEGDVVTLIGRDGDENLPVEEISGLCGTINYETMCDISRRVPRVYISGGQVVEVENHLMESVANL